MAYNIPDFTLGTLPASADLSASQYLFVVANSSAKVAVAGAGVSALGVLDNDPTLDQAATVIVSGVAKVKAGAAIAAGAKVQSNAAGKAITATSTAFVNGIALAAAAADNEVIPVLVMPMGHFALA